MTETTIQALADRVEIVERVTRVAVLADRRSWDDLRACFAGLVEIDYTALVGGEPEELPAEALMERWQELLESFAATQHLVTNHLVALEGDTATCDADVRATHFRPSGDGQEPVWQVGGFYHYGLVRSDGGWLVRTMRFVPTWSRGNPALSPTGAQVGA